MFPAGYRSLRRSLNRVPCVFGDIADGLFPQLDASSESGVVNSTSISVYIISKNEERRIGLAVRSVVSWADEVIVVDSGSTDNTVAIAEREGARVMFREWDGYGPQKHFAESQCRNKWVLNIDCDEEVTAELADEIQDAVNAAPADQAAFMIRITDLLPGELHPSWYAYSYRVLRLYNRDMGQMSMHQYQDRVKLREGKTTALRGRIYHHSFISWQATVHKLNFYTTQVAESRVEAGRVPSTFRLWTEFPLTFLKTWILRRLIFRGTMGMAMSVTVAYLNLLRLLKTKELAIAKQDVAVSLLADEGKAA